MSERPEEYHNHPAGDGCTPRCVVPADDRRECPDNCPGCNAPGGVGECGPDDRRERYAAALRANWQLDPDVLDDLTTAVMAVADEEARTAHDEHCIQAGEEVARLTEENARLRAELDSTKAAHRAIWDKHQQRGQWIFDLQGENARLRDALGRIRSNIRNGGASTSALIRSIDDIAREAGA
ncbi:hypothetical protein [Streptomyces asiaticus]|uniref:hypothetical protein n=1 Tax=Streptomyces asiaticus TaxID=114695 RepID=UPI001BABD7EF|nr:hypothetical protein [Streptomyces asiaticus]